MALISGENEASIRLFEKCGFECCANIRQVAEKFGKKLDLKMYQKIISDNSHLTPRKPMIETHPHKKFSSNLKARLDKEL